MNGTLDPTDIKILNLLQQDARLEIRQIAGLVHKSASPVHQRIRKLQEQGFIKGYVAVLDRVKIGMPLLAIVQVRLSTHTSEALQAFEKQAARLNEVQLCLHLSGVNDFILHVAVRHTLAYHDFLMQHICNQPNVAGVQTCFVLKECKNHGPYVL